MARILIAGGSGFIGGFLSRALEAGGHQVMHLSRSARPGAPFRTYQWDVMAGTIDTQAVTEADYIVNLAGAGIADGRWTKKRKKIIIDSRVKSAELIARTLSETGHRPRLYLSASGIGYYGDRGEAALDEGSEPGIGFLPESCILWEQGADNIKALDIPVFICRTGIVLHPDGGAMQKMLIPLHFFTSTYFGDGQQWYSWIHMDDIVGIYLHAIENDLSGVYNGVAPYPARNKALAEELPKAKGRPALVMPAPAFALRMIFGEMSHTILDSTKVSALKIMEAGYKFRYPQLRAALEDLV